MFKGEFTMAVVKSHTSSVAVAALLEFILVDYAVPDRRLADDQRSCEDMGHAAGTIGFRRCQADLNEWRCTRGGPRNGSTHVATTKCIRLI